MPEHKKREARAPAPDMAALAAGLKAKTADDWKTLYSDLKVSEAQTSILFGVIMHTVEDLCDVQALRIDHERYQHLKSRLNRLSKLLGNVEYELARAKEDLEAAMPRATREAVVTMLDSHEILSALGADAPVWAMAPEMPSSRREGLGFQGHRYPAREFEPFAWKFGVRLFAHTVQRLHAPIIEWLELARRHTGGAPPRVERDYLVFALAVNSFAIVGQDATTTANSRFVNLCTRVINFVGIGEDGLEDAIGRVLKRLDQDSPE